MNFRDDRRAVTVQVGSILLFGILILSMSMYQAQVVPADNERVEFDHNQRVQQDMLDTRSAILRSAATDTTRPVSISLGVRYPNRVLFVNPPPVSGRLSTTESDADGIVVENARALDGETADYWTGEDVRTFETRSLEYAPEYTEYRNPPTTVYENSVLYNGFGNGATLPESEQTLVDGRRISLVALDGKVSTARTGNAALDARPVSASTRTTTVTSDGDPIRISLATELSEEKWQELLEDEEYVTDLGVADGVLTITLEADQTYSLRMAKIGVGSGTNEESAAYVTDVEGNGATVDAGTSQNLVVEVRDRFGNPVSGESVDAEVTTGDGTVTFPEGSTTDDEGRVRVVYEAPDKSAQNEDVEVEVGYGDAEAEYATFGLTVAKGNEKGGGNGGGGG
ncbi:Ig-like domain-containing protein [Haloprofundus salilacus]|uniref:Ig-like domain-containing protein n=1 Tax=Haloprofundus salilacus TaxID=2876190 RepID=UPI001CCF9FBE|nr:Ig-like domain-containing protein [Haloprofundus salilacus]